MTDRLQFLLNRLRERLWVKPLVVCLVSIGGVFLAHLADGTGLGRLVPEITPESIEALLKIIASSMLVIATFAVASMVAAYASASSSATPRSFALIVADDTSQNALSTFIGVFIFSVVALLALMNGYYGKAGRFTLFALTVLVFVIVIVTFLRWVDSIARLGRLGNTIAKVEAATATAFEQRQAAPYLGGRVPVRSPVGGGEVVHGEAIGYLQRLDVAALQARAEQAGFHVTVAALPGAFCTPDRPLAYVSAEGVARPAPDDLEAISEAFVIGDARAFDQDPRFGLVVLSEIASRALSPAVNDPGTAIAVIGTLVRLFARWDAPGDAETGRPVRFDRVTVPGLSLVDMFDDAFTGIARDGAGTVEVAVRLQKGLETLAAIGDGSMRESAHRAARLALVRAEVVMDVPHDLEAVRAAAHFATLSPEQ